MVGCTGVLLGPARPDLNNIPSYPNAQNVTVNQVSVSDARGTVTITAFETADKASDILSFYKSKLLEQGWYQEENIPVTFVTGQDVFHFRYGNSRNGCVLLYGVDIVVDPAPNGGNLVEVHGWEICGKI
jgi:hypothetical protein